VKNRKSSAVDNNIAMMQVHSPAEDGPAHMKRDTFYSICHVNALPEHTYCYTIFTGFRSPDNKIKTLVTKED
jgi:hypothetical protein